MLGKNARDYGLKYSLQERLQTLYRKLGKCAFKHMVTLNTNYRCHESIIQISNSLFYKSKINVCSNAQPHHLAKFPLLFVCSSLTEKVDSKLEADILLEQVKNYIISNWPTSWGGKDWNKICLTTASRTQV